MRNVYQVLREKSDAVAQVRREVEALRSVAPFLADTRPTQSHVDTQSPGSRLTGTELCDAFRTVAGLLSDEVLDFDPGVRARLIEAGEGDFNRRTRRFSSWLRTHK
jgi:hypothetical protein